MAHRQRIGADWFGALIGFLTFLGGVALLAFTFKLAFDMFSVPPENALGVAGKNTLDVAVAGQSLASILTRIFLLLVMALVGSMVANRGIKLYISARALSAPKDADKPEPVEGEIPANG